MGKRAWITGAAAVVFSLGALGATPASAAIIIGVQEAGVNNGNITTIFNGSGSSAAVSGSYGTFAGTIQTALAGFPDLLGSTSSDQVSSTGGPGTLNIYVTETGVTQPLGSPDFLSSFTSNTLPGGWSVTEATYLDPNNGTFTGSPLSSATFNSIGVQTGSSTLSTGAGPYSLTEKYTLTATGAGTALSTIDISAVPEPAAWTLMLIGIGAIGAGMRMRRQPGLMGAAA